MNKHTLQIIVFLTAISVIGIIVTQTFWIRKSIIIAQKQFDHRADKALGDIVDELKNYTDTSFRISHNLPLHKASEKSSTIFDVIDTSVLKSIMTKYINYHMLGSDYQYAIVRTADDSIIFSTPDYKKIRSKSEPYKACLSCIWKEEYFHLSLCFNNRNKAILLGLSSWLFLSSLFILIIIFSFSFIIYTILRQKKLSELKNDFINNMTHEFKTPISTISLASEVLVNYEPEMPVERVKKYSQIIFDENQRMRDQVERVLNMAQHEKGELKLTKTQVDLHELILNTSTIDFFESSDKKLKIEFAFKAKKHTLYADELHLVNVIKNIIENAYKYSGDHPKLEISTSDFQNGILISFKDNGIGMSNETQKHIFEKFYRIPTGNVHNVKGFGLGLYYVKTMVEAHGGYIRVSGELNKGSRFDVYLPENSR